MSIIISVQDDLAQRLQAAAKRQSISAQELALTILDEAVPPVSADEHWGQRNQQRLALIRKSTREELSAQEQTQLDQLQSWLDEKYEPLDTGLLKQLEEMKQAIAQLSHEKPNA